MNLLQKRRFYKPMSYPWAFEFYQTSEKMHWVPGEVQLHTDLMDWHHRTSDDEKYLLTQLFRFFTQNDVSVADAYLNHFAPLFPHPEIRMMLASFAAREAIHIESYSLLIDTLGMPESEYREFLEYQEMVAKYDYITSFNAGTLENLIRSIAVYSGFTEGLQLFSSFAILLNFSRSDDGMPEGKRGRYKGMGQIITWSQRDETLHVEGMTRLFQELVRENPHVWTDGFKGELYKIGNRMVELEDCFIDLCFRNVSLPGLNKDDVHQYIRWIGNRRLHQLGLKSGWEVDRNPLPWLDYLMSAVEHTNFFESRGTEYGKGSLKGDWSQVWGIARSKS